jgi:hypothetical protein
MPAKKVFLGECRIGGEGIAISDTQPKKQGRTFFCDQFYRFLRITKTKPHYYQEIQGPGFRNSFD